MVRPVNPDAELAVVPDADVVAVSAVRSDLLDCFRDARRQQECRISRSHSIGLALEQLGDSDGQDELDLEDDDL